MDQHTELEEFGLVEEAIDAKLKSMETKLKMQVESSKVTYKLRELRFLREFLSLAGEEILLKEMSIAKDKNDQYNVRIPKEYADTMKIDSKKNKFMFKLILPPLNSKELPKLEGTLTKGDETSELKNHKLIRETTEILAKQALDKFPTFSEIPFNIYELIILKLIMQKRKDMTAHEIAADGDLTWPTTNKYLYLLKERGFVISIDKGDKKRIKWAFNKKYFEKLEKMAWGISL